LQTTIQTTLTVETGISTEFGENSTLRKLVEYF